jgi:hypothetical protein
MSSIRKYEERIFRALTLSQLISDSPPEYFHGLPFRLWSLLYCSLNF